MKKKNVHQYVLHIVDSLFVVGIQAGPLPIFGKIQTPNRYTKNSDAVNL